MVQKNCTSPFFCFVQIEHTKENERKKEKKNNRCTLIDKFNIIIFSFLIKSIDIYDGKK